MFNKLGLLAFVAAPLVSGLSLQVPTNPVSQGVVTIKWNSAQGDPDTWTFELVNVDFHDTYAIKNNVDPAPQELTLTLPSVPARDGYTLEAVNIGNITDVYAQSGSFSIAQSPSGTSGSTSGTGTTAPVTTRASVTGGTTNIVTTTSPSTTSPATTTSSGSSSSQAATTPGSFNGAASLGLTGGTMAAVLVSAIASVAMFSL